MLKVWKQLFIYDKVIQQHKWKFEEKLSKLFSLIKIATLCWFSTHFTEGVSMFFKALIGFFPLWMFYIKLIKRNIFIIPQRNFLFIKEPWKISLNVFIYFILSKDALNWSKEKYLRIFYSSKNPEKILSIATVFNIVNKYFLSSKSAYLNHFWWLLKIQLWYRRNEFDFKICKKCKSSHFIWSLFHSITIFIYFCIKCSLGELFF